MAKSSSFSGSNVVAMDKISDSIHTIESVGSHENGLFVVPNLQ